MFAVGMLSSEAFVLVAGMLDCEAFVLVTDMLGCGMCRASNFVTTAALLVGLKVSMAPNRRTRNAVAVVIVLCSLD